MKKVLAYITEDERDQSVSLNAIYSTYVTLLTINAYELDKTKIHQEIQEVEKKRSDFWFHLTNKYNIPYYVDKKMSIDINECFVYIEV